VVGERDDRHEWPFRRSAYVTREPGDARSKLCQVHGNPRRISSTLFARGPGAGGAAHVLPKRNPTAPLKVPICAPVWHGSHTPVRPTNRPHCGQGFGVCSVVMLCLLLSVRCSARFRASLPARTCRE
jgi:hypothetical protein